MACIGKPSEPCPAGRSTLWGMTPFLSNVTPLWLEYEGWMLCKCWQSCLPLDGWILPLCPGPLVHTYGRQPWQGDEYVDGAAGQKTRWITSSWGGSSGLSPLCSAPDASIRRSHDAYGLDCRSIAWCLSVILCKWIHRLSCIWNSFLKYAFSYWMRLVCTRNHLSTALSWLHSAFF